MMNGAWAWRAYAASAVLAAMLCASSSASGETAPKGGALAGQRPRVIVSTDVGGSPESASLCA